MRISQTRFRGFRNLENSLVTWHDGVNLLCGPNGAGKTNVLEALHILTGWGAFSGSKCSEAVRWGGRDGAGLAAQAAGERECLLEASIQARASLRLDGKVCRWGDLRNCVQSLSFLPEDMALIEGSPAVRRRFLDVLCALYFPLYALKLSEYRKIVQNRRYLLTLGKDVRVTQETMADLAAWIWSCRGQVLEALRASIEKWGDLLPRKMELTLKRGGEANAADPREDFLISLGKMEDRERGACTPLVGPHRDDLLLTCGGRAAAEVSSRGQRRRSALALVMAAASAVESRYRAAPVLLLDEVTSELDAEGRRVLMECLDRSAWQVFAATAEPPPQNFRGALWKVESGRIERAGL